VLDGTFDAPEGFNAAEEVLSGLARVPYRHRISLRVEGSVDDVRRRLPPVVATVRDGDEEGWAYVRINAERLDWVPAVLAGLGVPFVIERPDALRDLVRSLAAQLNAAATDAGEKDEQPS
jgi:predicted DNA-binding transcriptional regulator YafY